MTDFTDVEAAMEIAERFGLQRKVPWIATVIAKHIESVAAGGAEKFQQLQDANAALKARHNPEVCVDTMEYCEELKKERDELLAAAELVVRACRSNSPTQMVEAIEKITAAIEKCER